MPSILIAGALTIDRFADGDRAPGGSVIHAGAAAAGDGAEVVILTVSGSEPEAGTGRGLLEASGTLFAAEAPNTVTYGHAEEGGHRVLVLEAAGGRVRLLPELRPAALDVALFAPIADELTPGAVAEIAAAVEPRITAFMIQGWLRHLAVGEPARPMMLDSVDPVLWQTFGAGDLVVVSTEDLADGRDDPFAQAAALRRRIGPRPILVVTLGTEGYLLDDPAADRIVAAVPRTVVVGVATVGAGDTFGAIMALRLAAGVRPGEAADAGTDAVIRLLESRRA